jgi:hypothetical protein
MHLVPLARVQYNAVLIVGNVVSLWTAALIAAMFCSLTLCRKCDYQRFKGTYCFFLQEKITPNLKLVNLIINVTIFNECWVQKYGGSNMFFAELSKLGHGHGHGVRTRIVCDRVTTFFSGTVSLRFVRTRAVVLNISVSWYVMYRSNFRVNRSFRGNCWLHLQGWSVNQATNQQSKTEEPFLTLGWLNTRISLGILALGH